MTEQVFISYRRSGADVSAKLICEALKNYGFTVFYDYDSLRGGYFDTRIINAIDGCSDFVLVLPPNGLDRCVNEGDWLREEISTAIRKGKNIIPILLPGFVFPVSLPSDIEAISRINGIPFSMPFFDAMIATLVERMESCPCEIRGVDSRASEYSESEEYKFGFEENSDGGYTVSYLGSGDERLIIPTAYRGRPVTRIAEGGFRRAQKLKFISIPDTVKIIGARAFYCCSSLETIVFSCTLCELGELAFFECTALLNVDLPDTVVRMGARVFDGCTALLRVKLSSSLTEIPAMAFNRCERLAEAVIPLGVVNIGEAAFANCESLERAVIPGSVRSIGNGVFSFCSSLREVLLSCGISEIPSSFCFECKKLLLIDIPEGVEAIGLSAFGNCGSLECVSLPKSLKKIGNSGFEGCKKLEFLTIPDGVHTIESFAFRHGGLKELILSRELRYIGFDAFRGCRSLRKVSFFGGKEAWRNMRREKGCFPLFVRFEIY